MRTSSYISNRTSGLLYGVVLAWAIWAQSSYQWIWQSLGAGVLLMVVTITVKDRRARVRDTVAKAKELMDEEKLRARVRAEIERPQAVKLQAVPELPELEAGGGSMLRAAGILAVVIVLGHFAATLA